MTKTASVTITTTEKTKITPKVQTDSKKILAYITRS